MIVSRLSPHEEQTRLWPDDCAIRSPAALRPFVGRFFEETARVAFGLHRHITDSSADICPDLSDGKKRFCEVKSVRQGTAGIVYRDRLLRDRQLVKKTRGRMTYAFFVHDAHMGDATTLRALQIKLAFGLSRVYCVPLDHIEAECWEMEPKKLNYRTGGKELLGWRLPWSKITRYSFGMQSYCIPGLEAFGVSMPTVAFYGTP